MNTIFSILIIVTSFADMGAGGKTGVWLEEYAVPYTTFEQKQYKITVASIQGGDVPIDPRSAPTKEQALAWEKPMKELKHSVKLSAVDTSKYDAVYIPGGHGAVFDMPNDKTLKAVLEKFVGDGKLVASTCHGPASLLNINKADSKPFVEGKKVTSFTNKEELAGKLDKHVPFLLETELKNKGAIFVAKENWSDHIEIDGNLITGQNPQSSKSIAQAIIKQLQH
jgi:putative intracellular protease/amidase